MALRAANDDDWRRFVGDAPPKHWIGFTCEVAGKLEGIGGLYEAPDDGRWWAMFKRRDGVTRKVTAHRAARMTLECAKEARVAVHALADDAIANSEMWLRRLGFKETDEMLNNYRVWQWTP